MDGAQAGRTLEAVRRLDPDLVLRWRQFYNWEAGGKPNYGPPGTYNSWIGLTLRELCVKHGLLDRMPRYVAPGPLSINKRISEQLFLKTYDLELELAKDYRIWAYRKAAWTVDELPESVKDIYQAQGQVGLEKLPGVGQRLAGQIGGWLREYEQQTA